MNYISKNFQITGRKIGDMRIDLIQDVSHPALFTKELPQTVDFLETHLPSIFASKCFNDKKVSFKKEVEDTEIGHLFEHILIEYLKIYTEKKYKNGCFNGVTKWDWNRDQKGRFNINISAQFIDDEIFEKSFRKSVDLLEKLLDSYKIEKSGGTPALN